MCLKQKKGKIGENLACMYLQKNKYTIIDRNFRCRQGEIDIIACDEKKELVFIEVKTRSNLKYGLPSESVVKMKKNKIENTPIRFDVIEVLLNNSYYKINHIKDAFYYEE